MELAALVVPPILTAAMNALMPKMFSLVEARSSLRQDVQEDINSLIRELEMMWKAVQDYSRSVQSKHVGGVQAKWIEQVSQLAHKIEDCVDTYIYEQIANRSEMPDHKLDHFAHQIKAFRRESDQISRLREKYKADADAGITDSEIIPSAGEPSSSKSLPPVLPVNLVGTDTPLEELLDLVEEEQAEGQHKELKVISILGFDGLGKTVLAAQAYNHPNVAHKFENRAWVNAAGKQPRQVLQEILQQLQTQPWDDTSNVGHLSKHLIACLQNKRYFIVIDDLRTYLWSSIEAAFPVNDGHSSRVVVTTNLQRIANGCCSRKGYVYRMQGLDASFSEDLFFRSAHVEEPSHEMKTGSEELRLKCNGLPLALVSVAELLNLTKDGLTLTGITCRNVCLRLGDYLEEAGKHTALARMQEVLIRSYNCLPEDTAKAGLMCIGMFPSGHRIRRKRLIRLWTAEGLFKKSGHYLHNTANQAADNFRTLVDWNIVQPIDVSNRDEVRSCQPPGMMLEFIRHRYSTSLFCDKIFRDVPKHARHLSLHHCTIESVPQGRCDLSLVRSLTILGKACNAVLNFDNYRLLRVLDLEECDDLTNDHLTGICKLFLLNYLSLGRTITELPKEIARLEYLETLDVRRTKVEVMIPIEVIMITNLVNLFGKFKLVDNVSRKIPEFFKLGKSKLEILAGLIITDRNNGFLQLIAHMKCLRKVKIWCKSSVDSSNLTNLTSAIQKYIEDGKDPTIHRSISVDSDVSFKDISQFTPEGDFYITSLKLRGDLFEVPHFVASLSTLSELCLSSTTTLEGSLLTVLCKLTLLVYLKLVAAELVNFVMSDATKFRSLQRLCFVVEHMPVLGITGDPLPQLVSFQLLCNNNVGNLPLINERIGRKSLREVTVYKENNEESRRNWNEAAKRHPNRPRVFFVEKECGPAEDYSVATEEPQQKHKWMLNRFQKKFKRNKEKRRSLAAVGTSNNGHPDSMPLTNEATGVHDETSGSTAEHTGHQINESISNS